MSLISVFSISGSGMIAEQQRLTAVASNLANANSTGDASGQAYRAREVVFEPLPPEPGDGDELTGVGMGGVRVAGIAESTEPPRQI
ncbi:MAG: flagellar basal body rod protein FlgC, partial [Stellaceae bacterium]